MSGYAPVLLSPAAEPFASYALPGNAWLRAYDPSHPAELPKVPADAVALSWQGARQSVIAMGWERTGDAKDRWVFYVAPAEVPRPLEITFHLKSGERVPSPLIPEASLRLRSRLNHVAWFLLPTLGPKAAQVASVEFDSDGHRFPIDVR